MKLLVTGGAGFIGSNFLHYWRARHPNDHLLCYDKLTYAGRRENLDDLVGHPGFSFVKGAIEDAETLRPCLKGVDVVVHFAAESFVDRSIRGAAVFIETNVVGSQVLFDAAREARVARFIHISTDEVYGALGPTGYFTEETPYAPNNPYSASKAASDLLARAYFRTYGFPVLITHASNNYGPFQHEEKFIPRFILNALAGELLPLYAKGENVRDWLHVEDHCAGIEAAIEHGREGETYNFGGGCERSNLDVAQRICAACGQPESLIHSVEDRPGHDFRYAIDFTKAACELGYRPRHVLDEDLAELVAHYRAGR